MKSREIGTANARANRWLRAIADEYGQGSVLSSAQRLLSQIQILCGIEDNFDEAVSKLGQSIAKEGHTLGDAQRWLTILLPLSTEPLRHALSSRTAAVALAQGWVEGTVRRREGVDSDVQPLAALLHLIRQEYLRNDDRLTSQGDGPVLVVVDLSHVITDRMDVHRVRSSIVRHLREELGPVPPIAEGANGNLLALAERSPTLGQRVARVDQRIQADERLERQTIRVWVEPLATHRLHLESHLLGLVGSPLE